MNERDSRLKELKDMLLAKDYKPKLIDAAIEKALAVPWEEAIKRVVKNKNTDRKRKTDDESCNKKSGK